MNDLAVPELIKGGAAALCFLVLFAAARLRFIGRESPRGPGDNGLD